VACAGAAAAIFVGTAGETHSSVCGPGKTVTAPGGTVAAHLTAREVLENAAAALRQADVVPRGDQFVYTKVADGRVVVQTWLSVDGTRDGRQTQTGEQATTLLGCANGAATHIHPVAPAWRLDQLPRNPC
jgi:hypothetical protein